MVVTVGRNGKTRFVGIENRVLANMTPEQLDEELNRVKGEQAKLEGILRGAPRWARSVPENRKEANCLASERRRIERRLKELFEAELAKAGDAGDPLGVRCRRAGCPVVYHVAQEHAAILAETVEA